MECTFPNPKAKKSGAPRKKAVREQVVEISEAEDGKIKEDDVVDVDEEEAKDLGELDGWADDNALEAAVEEEDEDEFEDPSSGLGREEENGWKIIRGQQAQANGTKKRAVIMSDDD